LPPADLPPKVSGAPLSVSRLPRDTEQALVDSVAARIPGWKGQLLTSVGRSVLAQTTLSAIPVHVSISCTLSPWAISEIDRRRRAFVWAGTDKVSGGRCRVAWPVVCSPRDVGGLRLPDLRFLGFALRLRWEWLRRSDVDAPWALLPCRAEKCVEAMFNASVAVQIGDGERALFWTDSWLPDGPLAITAPRLFDRVSARCRRRTVRAALEADRWVRDITGSRTQHIMLEIVQVDEKLRAVTLSPGIADKFTWKWTSDGQYSSSSAYRAFFAGSTTLLGAKELWKTKAPPKVKFFFWLALHGRLWTAARRARHGLQQTASCSLCGQQETSDHLLLSCVFSREVWFRLLSFTNLQQHAPGLDDTLVDWWLGTRNVIRADMRKPFDSIVLLVTWEIWKERNRRTFDGASRPCSLLLTRIREEMESWVAAGYRLLSSFVHPVS